MTPSALSTTLATDRTARDAAARDAWADLAAAVRQAGRRVLAAEGGDAEAEGGSLSLKAALSRLKAESFPSEMAGDRLMAAALLAAGQAMVGAAVPLRRTTLAAAAVAVAEAVESLLAAQLQAVTAPWRQHLGEAED